MPVVLSIQSQVAGARVGNSVAEFAMQRLGVEVIALPTVLFGRRPDRGPPGGAALPAAQLHAMLAALDDDGRLARVDAVLSGYLGLPEHAAVVAEAVARVRAHTPAALYVCDPVLGDWESGLYTKPEVACAMRDMLLPLADLATPNAFEFGWLMGRTVRSLDEALQLARARGKPVLITSLPLGEGLATLLWRPEGALLIETARLANAPKGAGDLLTALWLARRLLGQSAELAAPLAIGAVFALIAASDGQDLPIVAEQRLLLDPPQRPVVRALPA